MKETFRNIPGTDVQVSSHGRLYKIDHEVKPYKSDKGYLKVNLTVDGVRKGVFVHRLVAGVFMPNPHFLPQINHIDGDKTNNRVDNLEWCDNSHNLTHAHKLGLRSSKGNKNGNSKLKDYMVEAIRKSYEMGVPTKYLAEVYGVHQTTIQRAINGKRFWKDV